MKLDYDDLPKGLRTKLELQLEERCVDFNDVAMSNVLWGLFKMNSNWLSLEQSTKTALFSTLSRVSLRMTPHTGIYDFLMKTYENVIAFNFFFSCFFYV